MRTRRSPRNQERLWRELADTPMLPISRKSTMSYEDYRKKWVEIEVEEQTRKGKGKSNGRTS